MKPGWLPRKGLVSVERRACPDYGPVNLDAPPKGVLHTTEGSFESALGVFRNHYAPHFLVGRDKRGRVRVVQLVRLGRTAGALENKRGGVETNSVCRVQIEIVGKSKREPWLPDQAVTDALARLLAHLVDGAGVPLQHPRVNRSWSRWRTAVGWVGHADVPENTHWDPGALKWTELLRLANAYRAEMIAGPDERRLATLRGWILKRHRAGWTWDRIKKTANFREFKRRKDAS